jgi:hypothetical protein
VSIQRSTPPAPVTTLVQGSSSRSRRSRAAEEQLPIIVSGGAAPFVEAIFRNGGASSQTVQVIDGMQTMGRGVDRVLLAPLALPDNPESLLLFKPSLGWL